MKMSRASKYGMNRLRLLLLLTLAMGILTASQSQVLLDDARQKTLNSRMQEYVNLFRKNDWAKLYDLVSKTGKGTASRPEFESAMKRMHGKEYGELPDLLEFKYQRMVATKSGEYDVYGCGKLMKLGWKYEGIAEIHAVYEENDWFITGWRHTAFPAEPCSSLKDEKWKPYTHDNWDKPMEEIRNYEKTKTQ